MSGETPATKTVGSTSMSEGGTAGRVYRIATRGSKLALWQANAVRDAILAAHPDVPVEIRVISTTGDRILDRPLDKIGDKGMFTKELEVALVAGEADMCVHSMKDVPSALAQGCAIGAMLPRADVRDALVLRPELVDAGVRSLADVADGTRIGSGSLRRVAQLSARYPGIEIKPIRGNVDTRVAKGTGGQGDDYDGAILAAAGLERMGLSDKVCSFLPIDEMVPAAGQGAVGVEIMADDADVAALVASIDDPQTHACVDAERMVLSAMGGSCKVPLGAHLRQEGGNLVFDAIALTVDGGEQARVHVEECFDASSDGASLPEVAQALAHTVVASLDEAGAREILAKALAESEGVEAPSDAPSKVAAAETGQPADVPVADAATAKPAKVYLVGAGPGDPGLATVKSVDLIRGASTIVYDYLSSEALLAYARPDAETIYVGKKGFCKHVTQDQINDLLVSKARELVSRSAGGDADADAYMVRLKGGDPFVFGRGGEEALALRAAGVPFEVVPGVTSGIAAPAYAGIPVTHRKIASSVTFVTGHEDPTRTESSIDWTALGRLAARGDTLCLYMGMHALPTIAERLISEGAPASTPVALVRWGSTQRQQTLVGTLEDIARSAEEAGFGAPAIILVGQVAALRDDLAWFENRPLFGKRIVVTRTRTQAGVLSVALEKAGAAVSEFPTIQIAEPTSYDAIDSAIAKLDSYDWIVFTSTNGVDLFFDRLAIQVPCESDRTRLVARTVIGAKVACIGSATAETAKRHGLPVDLVPGEYKAEGVVTAIAEQGSVEGARILIPRAEVARGVLPERLREMGAEVDVAPVYKTVLPTDDRSQELRDLLEAGEVDAITFTSSSTAKNLLQILGDDAQRLLQGVALCSIGPVTSSTLTDAGLEVAVESDPYTIPALVTAICDKLG